MKTTKFNFTLSDNETSFKMSTNYLSLKFFFFFFVLNSWSVVIVTSRCDNPRKNSQSCVFKESYYEATFLLDDISEKTTSRSATSRSTTTSRCRENNLSGGKLEYICDSADLTELPDSADIPKNLTRFILNKTKVRFDKELLVK